MPDNVMRLPHEPDHVIATQHGGGVRTLQGECVKPFDRVGQWDALLLQANLLAG
jgi:hypothetical protein